MIMIIVLLSRLIKLPVYFDKMDWIAPLSEGTTAILDNTSFSTQVLALADGAIAIVGSLLDGMAEHKRRHVVLVEEGVTN